MENIRLGRPVNAWVCVIHISEIVASLRIMKYHNIKCNSQHIIKSFLFLQHLDSVFKKNKTKNLICFL